MIRSFFARTLRAALFHSFVALVTLAPASLALARGAHGPGAMQSAGERGGTELGLAILGLAIGVGITRASGRRSQP